MSITFKYNLNLTKDYCSHWSVKDALRELIANNIDENGTLETFTENDESILFMTTSTPLGLDAFLMGNSVKSADNPIGHYGEGLKLAVLVLLRNDIPFTILTEGVRYEFTLEIAHQSLSTPTLHLNVIEESTPVEGTQITVKHISLSDVNYLYISSPIGLLSDRIGLYCQGMLVNEQFFIRLQTPTSYESPTTSYKSYGLNVEGPIQYNRDRTFSNDFYDVIAKTMEEHVHPKVFTNFGLHVYHSEYSLLRKFSDEYAQQILKWHLSISYGYDMSLLESYRVIIPLNSSTRYRKKDGYLISTQDWRYAEALRRGDDSDILEELKIEELSRYDFAEVLNVRRKKDKENDNMNNLIVDEVRKTESLDEAVYTILKLTGISTTSIRNIADHLRDELGLDLVKYVGRDE